MAAASLPITKFNKWHQYLKRDILMEVCKQIMEHADVNEYMLRAIVRNPGFDHAKYDAAFDYIDWDKYTKELIPLSDNEFKSFMLFHDPAVSNDTPVSDDAGAISRMIYRLSRDQLAALDEKDGTSLFDTFERVDASDLVLFASSMLIDIADASRVVPYIDPRHADEMMALAAFAARPDMTPAMAKLVYSRVPAPTNHYDHPINEARRTLASNPALSVDDVIEACGMIPEVMLNQQFTLDHYNDPRFRDLRPGSKLPAGNYRFPARGKFVNPNVGCLNPRIYDNGSDDHDWENNDICVLLAKNQYNKQPQWSAECRRSERVQSIWLRLVWRGLARRLPTVLVEHVLGIWYSPVA